MVADDDFPSAESAAGVFDDGVGLGKDFLEGGGQLDVVLDPGKAGLPIGGFLSENVVGDLLEAGFELVDVINERSEPADLAVVLRADKFFENQSNHSEYSGNKSEPESF
jgi:hypothetical protein